MSTFLKKKAADVRLSTAKYSCCHAAIYTQQDTVSGPGVCRWQRPAHGRFKCNIDASFSTFILAKTMLFSLVCSIDIGEALGLYHAVRWVHDL